MPCKRGYRVEAYKEAETYQKFIYDQEQIAGSIEASSSSSTIVPHPNPPEKSSNRKKVKIVLDEVITESKEYLFTEKKRDFYATGSDRPDFKSMDQYLTWRNFYSTNDRSCF